MPWKKLKNPLELPEGETPCLAWTLTHNAEIASNPDKLTALHNEIRSCSELLGTNALETCATRGLLCCDSARKSLHAEGFTSADVVVRVGQLICRWASKQSPPVAITVGVDTGWLEHVQLPGVGQVGFFGSAPSGARRLAETCPKERHVHLSDGVKDELRVLENLPFFVWTNPACTPSVEEYSLSPWVEVSVAEQPRPRHELAPSAAMRPSFIERIKCIQKSDQETDLNEFCQSYEDLVNLLMLYNVDLAQFGHGKAKSLAELSEEITKKKSYLVDSHGHLERRMALVRLDLHAEDGRGSERFLRLIKTTTPDGKERHTNRKLIEVIPRGGTMQGATAACFKDKFDLDVDVDGALFRMDTHCCAEERMLSPSVPGIRTVVVIYEATLHVINRNHPAFGALGLPTMQNFVSSDALSTKRMHWTWAPCGQNDVNDAEHLASQLVKHGICIHEFEPGVLDELVDEVFWTKISTLHSKNGELRRHLAIMKVRVMTHIMNERYELLAHSKIQEGRRRMDSMGPRPISISMQRGQAWEDATAFALTKHLGLDPCFQQEHVLVDKHSYQLSEELRVSGSYVGLKTTYRIHEVTCHILATHPGLGLPAGTAFSVTRKKLAERTGNESTVTTHFQWVPVGEQQSDELRRNSRRGATDAPRPEEGKAPEPDEKRRLPVPPRPTLPPISKAGCALAALMSGKVADWQRARNAAWRIRDRDYSCKDFYEDCSAAFPELALYSAAEEEGPSMSSGRSADDEYQRTMGALFAVYWLMRIDGDGAQAFTFGIGDDWQALSVTARRPRRNHEELRKRATFLQYGPWSLFEDVFVAAGLLWRGQHPHKAKYTHDPERTLALLVLTALHDIMKLQMLLPIVDKARSPFRGYTTGEVVRDHDLALAYVMEHFPEQLPSFAGLPKPQKRSVLFTQSGMEYNMGWLVQAEAPPGILFSQLKAVLAGADQLDPSDVSFYFTHWLTDLAGAEPFPQEGCEKYVLRFPQAILGAFLSSFPFVQRLGGRSETQVFEEYLVWRWTSHETDLGEVPMGEGSIACLRLVVMAQSHGQQVRDAFLDLPQSDKDVLSEELARTGLREQAYSRNPLPCPGGPAFLVYYAPALLQRHAKAGPAVAMAVLAEVLRRARELWPLQEGSMGLTVTLRIDALKELELEAMLKAQPGEFWVLERTSAIDGVVQKTSLEDAVRGQKEFDRTSQRILHFGGRTWPESELDIVGIKAPPAAHAGLPPDPCELLLDESCAKRDSGMIVIAESVAAEPSCKITASVCSFWNCAALQ